MTSKRSRRRTLALAAAFLIWPATAVAVTPACKQAAGIVPQQLTRRAATHLLMSEQRPDYPPLAQINYIGGNVSVLLTVDCAGKVEHAHVVEGHPFLAIAALQAIRKWIYRPFVTPAGPAEFQTTVKVDFSLLAHGSKRLPSQPDKFLARWVKPPQPPRAVRAAIAAKMADGGSMVHLRVLVNDKGRVVDSTLLSGTLPEFKEARRAVKQWRFKPARWGNLNVPWYSEVEVPADSPPQPSQGAH